MEPHYLHHTPGRLRVRTPELKRNQHRAGAVLELLQDADGVKSVELNPLTGSVTIHYAPSRTDCASLIARLSDRGVVDPERLVSSDRHLHDAASRAGRVVARAAAGAVIDRLLGGTPLAVLTAIV